MKRERTVRDDMRDRANARVTIRRWVETHGRSVLGELGDQLVLGEFDWREWFLAKPSAAFMNELDAERQLLEETTV